MAFKKELCTGKERHMGNWGGKDSSQTGVVNGFYVAFLCRIKFGVLFLLSAHKCSNDFICTFFFFKCWYHFGWHHAFISRMSTLNQRISCPLFLPPPTHPHIFSLLHVFPKSKHMKNGVFGVCNKQYVCVCECIKKRSLEKK